MKLLLCDRIMSLCQSKMETVLWILILVDILMYQGKAASVQYEDDAVATVNPIFLTKGQTFRVQSGDTLVLPCKVENLASLVLIWKRGSQILTAGKLMVKQDKRLHLVKEYDLQIKNINTKDAGDYICEVSAYEEEPMRIRHTVEILVAPTLRTIPVDGHIVIRKGTTVALECQASGNPVPTITWKRKNNLLPSGATSTEGTSITIENGSRFAAGIYQCEADNGVGPPITAEIDLQILYAPEIQVERNHIHSGQGHEAELVCIVHANPKPEVKWYRDTMLLDHTESRLMEQRGSRYTLLLRNVKPGDFGNYSCLANNNLGKIRKYIEVSGRPKTAIFKSDRLGYEKYSYIVSWAVQSYSPIKEYRLLYRRLNVNGTENNRGEWTDVIIPADSKESMIHVMSYDIRGLQPASGYEALVRAKNRYGWSKESEPFTFYTSGSEYAPQETPENDGEAEPEAEDLGMASSACTGAIWWSLMLILGILLVAT